MTRVKHFRARIERDRKRIPGWTADECRRQAADVRRAAEIAAFMGDDGPASEELYAFSDELKEAAVEKGAAP